MNMEEGALVEPVAVAVQITKVGAMKPNQTIVVFGCGPIGLLCQAVSKAYAAKKVIGVDIRSILYTAGCYPTAVDLIASGKIDVKRLTTNRFKFKQGEEAFDLVRQGKECDQGYH
ncbi:hypothetical protein PENSUB_13456 [Penicillium subrubescens]|uniref:D-xylulose reductase A n=1 Tax=Penicillium subrubescens TaxID=1316194 RepID=A0A1Q5SQU0_9EURO|nr:hypothetical protein PENSUB_13456 [Penicillium subrubescens]